MSCYVVASTFFSGSTKNETLPSCGSSKKAERDISVNWTVQLIGRSKLLSLGRMAKEKRCNN